MNKIIFASLLLTCTVSLTAQNNQNPEKVTSGTVIYQEVIKLDIKLEGEEAAQMANIFPKQRKTQKELRYNNQISLYVNSKEESDNNTTMESGNATIQIKMAEPDNKFYYDLQKKQKIEEREFLTRKFIIEDHIEDAGWKFTGKEKTILGYPCREATREKGKGTEHVWFAPSIPVSTGPADYVGLPGLVLAMESADGKHTITATSITFEPIDKKLLSRPRKGKKVSQKEFDEIVAEKMKEMGAQQGEGNGTMMIRIVK